MNRIAVLFLFAMILGACTDDPQTTDNVQPVVERFVSLDTNFRSKSPILPPPPLKFSVIFAEGDLLAKADGSTAPAKGRNDFLGFIPNANDANKAWLWCNHEASGSNDDLGDGGGGSLISISKGNAGWEAGEKYHVDFSPVGGTLLNCLGAVTPWGTIITSEEVEPVSNLALVSRFGIRDTTDKEGYPAYLNYGWMVEVDPASKKAVRKLYGMGRFMHEGALVMKDEKTVYLLDDKTPGVFFKFIADSPRNLGAGTLYAYKQSEDGTGGEWIAMPKDRESMNEARKTALQLGATIFMRLEDIEIDSDGTFYMTETGTDKADLTIPMELGGKPAKHLDRIKNGNIVDDPFGRILKFDPSTNKMTSFLEGGPAAQDPTIHLSNPDNMALDTANGFLVIQEDLIGLDQGRVPEGVDGSGSINEIYFLPLRNGSVTKESLQRFAIAPAGAETTGAVWAPDFETLFFNIQHPSRENPEPWNKACTIMVTGFTQKKAE